MCMLSYFPPNVSVDDDALFNGGLHNPDGHGWAIAFDQTMLVGKSLDLLDALSTFTDAREAHPEGHALFHSRFATHGSTTTDNVHPFYAGHDDGQTVVAHNGILPKSAWPSKGDDRSDTRLFADELLSTRYRRLDKERARSALANWCGHGNKLVILTVNPRYRHNAYLINSSQGTWDKASGVWHSNHDYMDAPRWHGYSTTLGTTTATVKKDWESCPFCFYGVILADGYCDECESCSDCMESRHDCQCWVRDAVDAAYRDKSDGQGQLI